VSIYTRRGDAGETDLFGGPRVGKEQLRVAVYGEVDELNALLGVCAAKTKHDDLQQILQEVQRLLFDLGAYVATPDARRREKSGVREPQSEDVARLERQIDSLDGELEPLRRFILPGGSEAAAVLHVTRTVCRRVERVAVELHRQEPLAEALLGVLNRLSDLLFTMARVENRRAGVSEPEWKARDR
jgi:cob(I)alamin adenosyltransferase